MGEQMKFDEKVLIVGTGCSSIDAKKLLPKILEVCEKRNINTPRRIAGFLANIGVESNGLKATTEGMSYSAKRMAEVWPSRFAVDPKADNKQPNDLAKSLEKKPEALANNVYANRMGNGPESSGDGFRYRGRGWMQVTGKAMYKKMSDLTGIDFVGHPELMETEDGCAQSAAAYWEDSGCNAMMDLDSFSQAVLRINGSLPKPENHGPLRLSLYRACVPELNKLK